MSNVVKVLAVVVLVVLLNVGLRFVDLPSVDIGGAVRDLDVPDWLQWANKAKNVALLALLAAVIIGAVVKGAHKREE